MTLHDAVMASEDRRGCLVCGSKADLWGRVVMGQHADRGLEVLQASGLLREVLPEVQSMVGFGGHGQGHKDLWAHVKLVVKQAAPVSSVRWAALFHDVGKVSTLSQDGKVSFHKHEFVSARLFTQAMKRTRLLDHDTFTDAHGIVRNLGLLEAYAPNWTDSAVRRLIKDLGEHFDRTLLLARADITTKHAHKRERNDRRLDELTQRAAAIKAQDAVIPPLPKGLGDALMAAFGIPPSKRLGDIKTALEKAVAEGRVEAHHEAPYYVEFLSGHREEFGL
jgi:poly(A) polymerase